MCIRDRTKGGKKGNVPYGTITTISESPITEGVIYVGSDDGIIHVTKNGGKTWKNISADLPQDLWVSNVYASNHDEKVIYASLDGYRWDNFSPYLFKSKNYGKTWESISSNLPDSPINVVVEDNLNKNISGLPHSPKIVKNLKPINLIFVKFWYSSAVSSLIFLLTA